MPSQTADPEPENQAIEEPEAESEAEPTAEPKPEPTTPEESGKKAASDAEYLAWLDKVTGAPFSSRYRTAEEAGKAIQYALESLAYLQRRQAAGGDATQPAADKPQEPAEVELPASFDHLVAILQAAESLRPGDPGYERALKLQQAYLRKQYEAVREATKIKSELSELKKQYNELLRNLATTGQEQELSAWLQSHAKEFYVTGEDGSVEYTPLAREVAAVYQNDPDCASMPEGLARYRVAYRLAKAKLPRPKGALDASPHAMHKPGLGRGGKKPRIEDIGKLMEQGMSDAEILRQFAVED